MATLAEQLDTTLAELETARGECKLAMDEVATLEAANKELKENNSHLSEQLTTLKEGHASMKAENERLKADYKTAEEKAAEYYGANAAPVPSGAKSSESVDVRFKAISDPTKQSAFLQTLNDKERAELFSNL